MGKSHRRKLASNAPKRPKAQSHKSSKPQGINKSKPSNSTTNKSSKQTHQQQLKPTIPFQPHESILLVGEGDLSFACSLITHHGCTNITATVHESSLEELSEKYPHVKENVEVIEAGGGVVGYGIDVTKDNFGKRGKEKGEKEVWERVMFNFPHVGGKTKDVNRQVRFNQELLVSFFRTTIPKLSPTPSSSIIVTLFEGTPYTLWNIRDLARHAALAVAQSFKFQSSAYPGYHHSRTLGVVKSKDGKESGAAWKGEERAARSYVFVRKGEEPKPGAPKIKGRREESSSDEDEDGEGIWSEDEEMDAVDEDETNENDPPQGSDVD